MIVKPMASPRGREAVCEALLEAATELFASRDPASVSVRDIASRAGVNHGLVHRHFGSKDQLRLAVMDRLARQVNDGVGALGDAPLDQVLEAAFAQTNEHAAYFRILARAMLDGEDPRTIQTHFPLADRLIELARQAGHQDPRGFVARRQAAGLGWLVFERYIRAATGIDGTSEPTD